MIPPVGMNLRPGKGAEIDFQEGCSSQRLRGKELQHVESLLERVLNLGGRAYARIYGEPVRLAVVDHPGVEARRDHELRPASLAAAACPGVSTVPAPSRTSGTSAAIRRIASAAPEVRKVISAHGRPPSARARASGAARSGSWMTTTGTTPRRPSTSSKGVTGTACRRRHRRASRTARPPSSPPPPTALGDTSRRGLDRRGRSPAAPSRPRSSVRDRDASDR